MSRQNITYNDFSFGELSHNLFGRGNVNAYRNSAMNLTNFDVIVTGGIERRCGTKFITELDESGKLVAFEYSSDKKFLLFFGDEYLDIYNEDEELIETLSSPYEFFQLPKLCWSQKGQDIYFVHPDVEPMILRFDVVNNSWDFSSWVYAVDGQNGFTFGLMILWEFL